MRRVAILIALLLAAIGTVGPLDDAHAEYDPPHRAIVFPVYWGASFRNDWGECRSSCTSGHAGNDLYAPKMRELAAAFDGVVTVADDNPDTIAGNNLSIRSDDGWVARYVHVNNDSPGTNDNANPSQWVFGPGIAVGARVTMGQVVGYLGNSGNAENSTPHLHFELYTPSGVVVNPYDSLRLALGLRGEVQCAVNNNPPNVPADGLAGYWLVDRFGGVFTYGGAPFFGSAGGIRLNASMLGMGVRPQGDGYWLYAADGGIFTYGGAQFYGSTGGMRLNQPVVAMAVTPSGRGYWLVASDGGVFTFGDAQFYGSTGGFTLNRPVVGMRPTKTGAGYWLVAADGGIFSFGDAQFYGSTGAMALRAPINGIEVAPGGNGYWLFSSDGGVFTFGMGYFGSVAGVGRCSPRPVVAMLSSKSGNGYVMVSNDGTVRAYGDARNDGDASTISPQVVGAAAVPR